MTYHQPQDMKEALQVLGQGQAKLLAGGTDIYPTTERQSLQGNILDITGISALSGISEAPDHWRIGATTKWAAIAGATLPPAFRALQAAAKAIGSVQIQNSGTIGGNICNASPAADGIPPLLILDAIVELASSPRVRHLLLSDFVMGVRETALEKGEILTAIIIPKSATTGMSAFLKSGAREYLVIAIASVALRMMTNKGTIDQIAIAVGSCGPVAQRLNSVEKALTGYPLSETDAVLAGLKGDIGAELSPISDIRADRNYRLQVVAEFLRRILTDMARHER